MGASGALLLDPGSGVEEDRMLAGIAAAGCALLAVRAILLTHAHVDHALGAGRLREHLAVPLMAPSTTADFLRRADLEIWREHPGVLLPTIVDKNLVDGQTLDLD